MQLAYLFPEYVERMALISTGGLGKEVHPLLRASTLPGSEWVLPLLASERSVQAGDTVRSLAAKLGIEAGPDVAEFARGFASLVHQGARDAFLETMRSVIGPDGQKVSALDRLYLADQMPFLLIWGDEDPVIPVEHGRRAHELVAHSHYVEIEGSGHWPMLDAPERIVEELTGFIEETEPFEWSLAQRARAHAPRARRLSRPEPAVASARSADQEPRPRTDPAGGPRRPRSRLHPREPARPLGARLLLLPRRGPRSRADPRRGSGAAGRQPLRRQRHAGHDGLHPRLRRLLRGRAAPSPTRPQPGPRDASSLQAGQVRLRVRLPPKRQAGARPRRRRPRLSRRGPRGTPSLLAVGQGGLRRAQGVRQAGARRRRADRSPGGGRRPGDLDLPLARRATRQGAATRSSLQAEGGCRSLWRSPGGSTSATCSATGRCRRS